MKTERDITHLFLRYRETARGSWNVLFHDVSAPEVRADSEAGEAWQRYANVMFSQLVLRPTGMLLHADWLQDLPHPRREPLPCFRVSLVEEPASPIFIENPRVGDATGYWDYPLNAVRNEGFKALFIDFFDWDDLGMRDFDYVLVKIIACNEAPETAGRRALLETRYCRFSLVDGPS